jgi:hypothetical protein
MVAYEFSTHLTDDGELVIPPEYRQSIRRNAPVRVILLLEENGAMMDSTPMEGPGLKESDALYSLEEIVASIQQMGPNFKNVTLASGRLAEKLAHPVSEPDPSFDTKTWEAEWQELEAAMEAESLAQEEDERRGWAQ